MIANKKNVCSIDGFQPNSVVQAESVSHVGDLVRRAAAEESAIYPLGGGTMLTQGLPPTRPGHAIDLRQLNQVIDYPSHDMTITVQAGITLAQLQALLAKENQRLPVDVPLAEQATLGGAIATNTSGLRRYGFGTLRDYVIGISVVNDEGQEVKAGGRVVKNVAGYDLCKLHIGALGTLGIVTQVTLKLKPLPEQHALLTLGCKETSLEALLDALHRSRTRPVCIDLLNAAARVAAQSELPRAPWAVVVGFEDNREAAEWQVDQLRRELAEQEISELAVRVGNDAVPLWQALVEFTTRPEACLVFKANVLPSATVAFCREVAALEHGLLLQAHAGNGIVIGQVEAGLSRERAEVLGRKLLEAATERKGNLSLPRCPSEWKKTLPVWGAPPADGWLMRAVKYKLDPRGLFNPDRFVAGL
jgi:glycolate oxidase FAD binding subunit